MDRIELEKEADGRWLAEVSWVPGAMAYGATREEAVQKVLAIAAKSKKEPRCKCISPSTSVTTHEIDCPKFRVPYAKTNPQPAPSADACPECGDTGWDDHGGEVYPCRRGCKAKNNE